MTEQATQALLGGIRFHPRRDLPTPQEMAGSKTDLTEGAGFGSTYDGKTAFRTGPTVPTQQHQDHSKFEGAGFTMPDGAALPQRRRGIQGLQYGPRHPSGLSWNSEGIPQFSLPQPSDRIPRRGPHEEFDMNGERVPYPGCQEAADGQLGPEEYMYNTQCNVEQSFPALEENT